MCWKKNTKHRINNKKMHALLEGGNLMTLFQPDGYDIPMVDVSISNFDYSIRRHQTAMIIALRLFGLNTKKKATMREFFV